MNACVVIVDARADAVRRHTRIRADVAAILSALRLKRRRTLPQIRAFLSRHVGAEHR